MGPDAAVGGVSSPHIPLVHPDPASREAHPVGHAGTLERSTLWHGMDAGVGVGHHDFAGGIPDFSVKIRVFGAGFLDDLVGPGWSAILRASGGNAVIHCDLVVHKEKSSLFREVDLYFGVRPVGFGEEDVILPRPRRRRIRAIGEVCVTATRMRIDQLRR